ncbi:MAG: 2-oxoacid:acceptor oxidoreductase family protein, partial [Deltaproteobacteria bacterium]|nr:2-oxoacid:acceptor oxidoreductase family protein [Deltaproteobacteria bacterium]
DAQSTIISDGEADVLVGFEPSETLRALNKCNPDTVVITNTAPLPPFTVGLGIGVYPEIGVIEQQIKNKTARLVSFDGIDLAKKAGNVMSLNIVLLGALIQSDILPLTPESIKKAIETTTKKAFVETNLEAFQLGFEAAKRT